jgi:hypothetical protein
MRVNICSIDAECKEVNTKRCHEEEKEKTDHDEDNDNDTLVSH